MPAQTNTAKSAKGNPAHKRMGNPRRKDRRAASWLRGQKRKEARRKEQKIREDHNRELRAQGKPTPYQAQKLARLAAKRKAAAVADPAHAPVAQRKEHGASTTGVGGSNPSRGTQDSDIMPM